MPDLEEQVVQYARNNIAKVTVFLMDPYVKRFIREEKISEITFVGTVGGLLGLFLGFSFVSSVEIVYLLFLRATQLIFGGNKQCPSTANSAIFKKERSSQTHPCYIFVKEI